MFYVSNKFELMTVEILCNKPLTLWLMYIPQSLSSTRNLILMGDFNTPNLHWDTFAGYDDFTSQLCDILFDANLFQYIDKPTHVHGNIATRSCTC